MAEVALKAEVGGLFAEVPFAGHGGEVTSGREHFGENDGALEALVAGLAAPTAAEEADAAAVALRRVVELGEAQAARGEFVEVGRFDLAAVATEVGEAHVVGHDEEEIRLPRKGRVQEDECRKEGEKELHVKPKWDCTVNAGKHGMLHSAQLAG